MAETKIRFYKYMTPPKEGGATVTVGNKTIAGSSFASTIKAVNSLGATVNSIGVMLSKNAKAQVEAQQQQARAQQLAADRARENKIEAGSSRLGEFAGGLVKSTKGFLEGLLGAFGKLLIFGALKWLGDPKNREKIENVINGMKTFFNWMVETFTNISTWIKENWEDTFGKDKTFQERLRGASKLLLGAGLALASLAFLRNPIRTIANFTKLISLIGKGILTAGKFFGGNVVGQAIGAGVQGYMAYQDVIENYEGPEEDRLAAARGAGAGAAIGGMGLAMIGNKIAGPIGGLIGNALGGFLGKEAGKFLGPIVGDFFNTMKEIFDTVLQFLDNLMKPLGDAFKDFMQALGPAIDKVVSMIKPHLPVIMEVAGFLGKVAFAPLIGLMQGLTKVLKFFTGGDETPQQPTAVEPPQKSMGGTVNVSLPAPTFKQTVSPTIVNLPEFSKGGSIYKSTARMPSLPEFSKGGWISGPQSGYPVSLTGKGVDFIGHGTEYVAQKSSGGFVIPFDTPHTRRDPGLTGRRIKQARSSGFLRSAGGPVPEMSLGGFLAGAATNIVGSMMGSMLGDAQNKLMSAVMPQPTGASGISMNTTPVSGNMQPKVHHTGNSLAAILAEIKTASQQQEGVNMEDAVKAIVADIIELPTKTEVAPGAGGGQTPIPVEGNKNPAADFLTSRFGLAGEAINAFSNFF